VWSSIGCGSTPLTRAACEKTIETHLTRVFQKLGLRSRTQLAAEVARPA
jgi:DNA-binding NarL/FixJ family response regulator